jgi:hypothetical protein
MQAAIETKLEELSEIRHKTTNVLRVRTSAGCATILAWAFLMTERSVVVDATLTGVLVVAWLAHLEILRRMSSLWARGDQLLVELDAALRTSDTRDIWPHVAPQFKLDHTRLETTIYLFGLPLGIKLCMWLVRWYHSIAVT